MKLIVKICLILSFLCLSSPIYASNSISNELIKLKYDSIINCEKSFYYLDNLLKLSKTKNSFYLPFFGYYINSNNQMYLKTREFKYLELNYHLIKSNLKVINEFKLLAPKGNQNRNQNGQEFILFEGYYFRYVSQFFYIVKRDQIFEFSDIDIYISRLVNRVNLWNQRSYNRFNSDYLFHKNTLHIWALWIHTFCFLGELNEDFKSKYSKQVSDFFIEFDKSLFREEQLEIWNVLIKDIKGKLVPDISHSNHIVSLFYDVDFFKLRNIDSKYYFFKNIFLNFNLEKSQKPFYIDGGGLKEKSTINNGYLQSDGWMKYIGLAKSISPSDDEYIDTCYYVFFKHKSEIENSYLYLQFLSNFYISVL